MRLGNTTHHTDDLLFRESRLSDDPSGEAAEWVDKPETEHLKKKFGGMTKEQWNKYLDDAKEEGKAKKREEEKKKEKKRKREREEEKDKAAEKRDKKKKKRDGDRSEKRQRIDSPDAAGAGSSRHKSSLSGGSNNLDD